MSQLISRHEAQFTMTLFWSEMLLDRWKEIHLGQTNKQTNLSAFSFIYQEAPNSRNLEVFPTPISSFVKNMDM